MGFKLFSFISAYTCVFVLNFKLFVLNGVIERTFGIDWFFFLLQDKRADLSLKIEEGFGPNGLGILSITDVRNEWFRI